MNVKPEYLETVGATLPYTASMSGCGILSFTLCFGLHSPIPPLPLNSLNRTNCFTSGIALGFALEKTAFEKLSSQEYAILLHQTSK